MKSKAKIILGMLVLGFALITNLQIALGNYGIANNPLMGEAIARNSSSLKGPLCSNQDGSVYCCKGSSGDCSAGATCASCR